MAGSCSARFAALVLACGGVVPAWAAPPAGADPFAPILSAFSRPAAQAYLDVERLRAKGIEPVDARSFAGRYGPLASFVGDYATAERVFGASMPPTRLPDPAADGYVHASKAGAPLLERVRGRRAVFINESHGHARTRAAIYTLLGPLRDAGFTHLAIETLTTAPRDARVPGCATDEMWDRGLAARGFAVSESGYYTREPVFGEIIREAVRLGFRLVAYEHASQPDESIADREQGQARNLACVFERQPDARLVGIVGHAHASKATSERVPEGWMAARFARLTGIEPFTVDTTLLLGADVSTLRWPAPMRADGTGDRHPAEPFVLSDAAGKPYTRPGYDLALLVAPMAERGAPLTGHWLELGGARLRQSVPAAACGGARACIIEARPLREGLMGTPADSCLVRAGQRACMLYLAAGRYLIRTLTDVGERDVSLLTASVPPP